MITGQIAWTLPGGRNAFAGPSPIPFPPDVPPAPQECQSSVGGVDGKLYQEPEPWKETCKMFND